MSDIEQQQQQQQQQHQPVSALARALANAITDGSQLRQFSSEGVNWTGKYQQGQIHVQTPTYDERSAKFKVRIEPNQEFEVRVQRSSSSSSM